MGVHVVSYRLIIPYLSVLVPVLVCTMEIPDIGKGSPDLGVLPSVEERTKAGIHHARYTTEEASRESALATCLNAGDDLMYDDNNTTQENEDATMEQDMIDDAGERVEDQFLNPSLGAWQKPYDVLIPNAIRRCRKGATKHGATRCEIIKYIKCKNPKMKYCNTVKGVGRALCRMTRSGHLVQRKRGRYTITAKGQRITHKSARFDRRICNQRHRYQYRRSCDRRMKKKKRRRCAKRRRRRRCGKRRRRRRCGKGRRRRRCGKRRRRRRC